MRTSAPEQRPVGGYLCRCGQRQGAHNGAAPRMPSFDGECAGFVLAEERGEPDPHAAHRLMAVAAAMANCPPCGISKILWMLGQPEHTHEGRHGRRLAAIHGVIPRNE